MKYGYLDTGKASDPAKSSPLISSDGLKSYIEEFQAFANLSVTGHLDQETLEMMERPRCGGKDFVGYDFCILFYNCTVSIFIKVWGERHCWSWGKEREAIRPSRFPRIFPALSGISSPNSIFQDHVGK